MGKKGPQSRNKKAKSKKLKAVEHKHKDKVAAETAPLLEIKNLQTHFHVDEGVAKAVDGVSYTVHRGRTLGVVGESGCGKSVTAMSVMDLIPQPPGKIVGGEIIFDGKSLLKMSAAERRALRGDEMGMIFQEPMTSLNPVFTVGEQIAEGLRLHRGMSRQEALDRAVELLDLVRIPAPEERIKQYPHEMSGGMKQRVMIALALSCDPKLLIADEPTTALDVTIQAQILNLMRNLQLRIGMSIILITHNLGVVAELADDVVVMYAGRIVERAPVNELFERPRHPYTKGLFKARPLMHADVDELYVIPGSVPNPLAWPPGCRFAPRCPYATAACRKEIPELEDVGHNHQAACIRLGEID